MLRNIILSGIGGGIPLIAHIYAESASKRVKSRNIICRVYIL